MGGPGSGDYYRWKDKKDTVNNYIYININQWREKGKWKYTGGYCSWSRHGNKIASINYTINVEGINLTWSNRQGETITQKINLITTKQKFGNERYYFQCPKCGRKAFKLYAGSYFYCRYCYNLTYTSCQESHCNDRLAGLLGLTPQALKEETRAAKEYWPRPTSRFQYP
jgi:ribosomal protein L37AE/L43A